MTAVPSMKAPEDEEIESYLPRSWQSGQVVSFATAEVDEPPHAWRKQ
jgi:hypothetical protein